LIQVRNKQLLRKLALRLKELRAGKGLTQEDVYNDTGINIGRVERAISDISISTLERLCNYYKIPLRDFFKKGF
jgi:transcriptional regulator with XRE-family HTH domain